MVCELRLDEDWSGRAEAVDHMIPLSSNVLNKSRGVPRVLPKKVATQSFGSNDQTYFLLACSACNGFKFNRFERDLILKVLRARSGN